jgi:hypothetical protein
LQDISVKDDLPSPETFRFQERAKALLDQWSRFTKIAVDDYAEGSGFKGFTDVAGISPVLHDMMRARKMCMGPAGGLNEVILENLSGERTIVTLPCP